jgi:AraC family transcriptional regulator of adaptative response / DNA-3-methyladenine glycosylase II
VPAATVNLHLGAPAPFDGEALLGFLAVRAIPGVEDVDGATYRRHVPLTYGGAVAGMTPRADGVDVALELDDARDEDEAVARVRRLWAIDADPDAVAAVLRADPLLRPLVDARPGLRVPGIVDGWELAVRAVLGQQVSVAAARTLAARLVERFGEPLARPRGAVTRGFPAPDLIRDAPDDAFAMPRSRIDTLRRVAALAAQTDPAPDELLALPGIGPWTAGYVALRRGDADVWLPTDAGVLRALRALGATPDPERWRPYRSYAVMHLWAIC